MADVFISYAKADNQERDISFIVEKLTSTPSPVDPDTNITAWFDEQGIRKGEHWEEEIQIGLEQAHTVAIFISPQYFASMVCNQELERAIELGKKLIPIWVAEVKADDVEAQIDLRKSQGKETADLAVAMQNYVAIRDKQGIRLDFDSNPEKTQTLDEFIRAIFENAQLDDGAAEWLERALARERKTGSWLTSNDLKEAEKWLKEAENNLTFLVHKPTRQYILNSRRKSSERNTILVGGILFAITVIVFVTFEINRQADVAQINRQIADNEQALNESRRLAALSGSLFNRQTGSTIERDAALLAIRGLNSAYTIEAHEQLQMVVNRDYEPQVLMGLGARFDTATFSPDGMLLAAGDWDGNIFVWDALTLQQLQNFEGHEEKVNQIIFSHDSGLLITASDDHNVKVWDTDTFELHYNFDEHRSRVNALDLNENTDLILSASSDNMLYIWNPTNGQIHTTFEWESGGIEAAAFSPIDNHIVVGGWPGLIKIWDLDSEKLLQEIDDFPGNIYDVDYSHDGSLFAVAYGGSIATIVDAESGERLRNLFGHAGGITSLAFSPVADQIATASNDGTVRIWHSQTSDPEQVLVGHTGWVYGVTYNNDGSRLVSASDDTTIRPWYVDYREFISLICSQINGDLLDAERMRYEIGTTRLDSDGKKWLTVDSSPTCPND